MTPPPPKPPPALIEVPCEGAVVALGYMPAPSGETIPSEAATHLDFGFEGAPLDTHAGVTRPSCSRVRHVHPVGTEIRNTRQVSIVSEEELAEVAAALGLDALDPRWLGATVVLRGVPDLSHLPPAARLQGPDGLTLVVDLQNHPCSVVNRTIEAARPGRGGGFREAARGLRGVTASVERPGALRVGDRLRLFVPSQRPWRGPGVVSALALALSLVGLGGLGGLHGCAPDPEGAPAPRYPRDAELRVNHLQALGTHNSYHLRPPVVIPPWDYAHLPLARQLEEQGVRQVELDLHEEEGGALRVYHIERLDPASSCDLLTDCLAALRAWSDAHLDHHPLMVLLEPKRLRSAPAEALARVEEALAATWPAERLLTPALVQRGAPSLRAGLEEGGWPTLGEARGRLMVVWHADGEERAALVGEGGDLGARLLFPDAYGDLAAPFAAYHSMNDPVGGAARIAEVVGAGHLVRTRADSDGEQARAVDFSQAEAAFASGAHFISTDFPTPAADGVYGVQVPGGAPSRCNPLTAPEGCAAGDVERLGR